MKSFVGSLALALLVTSVTSTTSAQAVDLRWTEIPAPFTRTTDSYWGRFVSFDGDRIVVSGPGHVDVFRWDGSAATYETSLVATSGDSAGWGNELTILQGGRVVVQARDVTPPPPALYVFSNASGSWSQVARMVNPVTSDYGDQGIGAVAFEGSRLIVGVPYGNTARGYASVIHADGAGAFAWTLARESRVNGTTDYGLLGSCVDVRGDRVVIGTLRSPAGGYPLTGRVALYRDTGSVLSPIVSIDNPTPGADEQFGASCAVLPDGFLAAARYDDTGGTDAGAVYVFDDTGRIVQTIFGPSTPSRALLGNSMSLHGSWVAIGAPTYLGSGIGSFFLYRRDASGMFRERRRVMPADVGSGPNLGGAMSLHGNAIVVGVQDDSVAGATRAGRAWIGVFTEPDGGVCSADAECTNGHCVDGICCNTTCAGACDVCGTGTCVSMMCDAGASMPDASVPPPDAALESADAFVPPGVDAATEIVDAAVPPGVDAGRPDAAMIVGEDTDVEDVDAGGTTTRVPLSCTCRAGSERASQWAIATLSALSLALLARRRRSRR